MTKSIRKFLRQSRRGERGFTLIELLIVVAILGVLAAVAIPNIASFVGTGDLAAANTELASVQSAAVAYRIDNPTTAAFDETLLTPYLNKAPVGAYFFTAEGMLDINGANQYPAASPKFDIDPLTLQFKKIAGP